MIVLDASALTLFLLGEMRGSDVFREELEGRQHDPFHVPEVVEPETLNALRGLVFGGRITVRRATVAVADLARTRLRRYSHSTLRDRIWELRDQLSAYDAAYLALAEGLRDSVLVTGDSGLAARARASLGHDRVRKVG